MLRGSGAGVLGRSGASRVGARRGTARRSAGRLRVAGGGGVPRSPVLCGSRHTVRRGRRAGVRREGCSGVGARRWAARHGAGGSVRWAGVSRVRCERERGSRGPGLASRSGHAQQQLLRRGCVSRVACACVVCLADELARKHAWVASLCLRSLTCMLMLVLCCVCSSMWVSHSWAQQEEEGLARRKLVGVIMD